MLFSPAALTFGESRNVCNVHWHSDVVQGRTLGAATLARLHAEPAFRAELEAVRAGTGRRPHQGTQARTRLQRRKRRPGRKTLPGPISRQSVHSRGSRAHARLPPISPLPVQNDACHAAIQGTSPTIDLPDCRKYCILRRKNRKTISDSYPSIVRGRHECKGSGF